MEILSVISCLLDYPSERLEAGREDMLAIIVEADLADEHKRKLVEFVKTNLSKDLMEWQAEYDGLFERGRSLGLWLFEHVHGESRDRGQAMVDLVNVYRQAGLEISQHELPDYIPMFLEFLGTQGRDNAAQWLCDVEHVLGLLLCRLENRGSDYSVLFEALLDVANSDVDLDEFRQQISTEKRDDTKQAIDKEWEEEEVTFGSESIDKACDTATRRPSESQRRDLDVPVNWVDFETNPTQKENRVEGM